MVLTAETYRRIVAEDPNGTWELVDGRLREKPGMSFQHHDVCAYLSHDLIRQLNRAEFRVHIGGTRLERTERNYVVPDIAVIPASLFVPLMKGREYVLDFFAEPLPLVVEVWSPSTGSYDVDEKIPQYKARGDKEIWRIHPYERTLTIWRLQSGGTFVESFHRDESVSPAFSPNVVIDLAALFI